MSQELPSSDYLRRMFVALSDAARRYVTDPQALTIIADATREVMGADWVTILIVDEKDWSVREITSSPEKPPHIQDENLHDEPIRRQIGHTAWVMQKRDNVVIGDVLLYQSDAKLRNKYDFINIHPATLDHGYNAVVCLPLSEYRDSNEKPIGVMWLHFKHTQSFENSPAIDDLKHFTRFAATAYLSSQLVSRWENAGKTLSRMKIKSKEDDNWTQLLTATLESLAGEEAHLYLHKHNGKIGFYTKNKSSKGETSEEYASEDQLPHLVRKWMHRKDPKFIPDVDKHKDFRARQYTQDNKIRSVIVFPLKARRNPPRANEPPENEALGVMFVNFLEPLLLPNNEQQRSKIMQAFHFQITGFLEKSLSLYREQRQRRKLHNFFKLSSELLERDWNQERNKFLSHVAQRTRERGRIEADLVNIVLMDGEQLVDAAGFPFHEKDAQLVKTHIRSGAQPGLTKWIMKEGKRVLIPDVRLYKPALDKQYGGIPINPDIDEKWKAIFGVPLKVRGRTVGVIWLNYETPRLGAWQITEEEIDELETYANIIGIVYQVILVTKRHTHALDILQEAVEGIRNSSNEREILTNALKFATKLINQNNQPSDDVAYIALLDTDRLVFDREINTALFDKLLHESPLGVSFADSEVVTVPLTKHTVCTSVAKNPDQPMHIKRGEPPYVKLFPDFDHASQIAVPVMLPRNQQLIAVLGIERAEKFAFDDEHLETLKALAIYLGKVIEYSRAQTALNRLVAVSMEDVFITHFADRVRKKMLEEYKPEYERLRREGVNQKNYRQLLELVEEWMNKAEEVFTLRLAFQTALGDRTKWSFNVGKWLEGYCGQRYENIIQADELEIDDRVNKDWWSDMPAEWLAAGLAILVDNARDAVAAEHNPNERKIKVRAYIEPDVSRDEAKTKLYTNASLYIEVENGVQSVPKAVRDVMFMQPILNYDQHMQKKGKGIGLFTLRYVLDYYDGEPSHADLPSGRPGAIFRICLPVRYKELVDQV